MKLEENENIKPCIRNILTTLEEENTNFFHILSNLSKNKNYPKHKVENLLRMHSNLFAAEVQLCNLLNKEERYAWQNRAVPLGSNTLTY